MIDKAYTKIVWDLNSNLVTPSPLGVTSDTGRGIQVRIKVDGVFQTPVNPLRLVGEKEDGSEIYLNSDIGSDHYLFTKLAQLFALAGTVTARLELQEGTDFISSNDFSFQIPSSVALTAITSSDDYNALQAALVEVEAVTRGTELLADQVQNNYNKVTTELTRVKSDLNTLDLELTNALSLKAEKTEVDTALALKADKATTYTKTEVDTKDGLLVPKTTTVNGKALSANVSVTATDVPITPTGGIAATTVQAAINELDAEKANKAQEAWITPTLLNGATGTLKFMKDQFGFVHFRGLITISATGNALTLPVGYRPPENEDFATHRGAKGSVWSSNGTVYIWDPPLAVSHSLTHFTFKAV